MQYTIKNLHVFCESLEKFEEVMREFRFPHETDSYYDFIIAQENANQLFHFTMQKGFPWMQIYITASTRKVEQLRQSAYEAMRLADYHKKQAEIAGNTGDEEFDNFRKACQSHDWYFSYSDDNAVWRRGNEVEKSLMAQVGKHEGKYRDYWNYISRKNGRS